MRSADDVRRVFELWEVGHSKAAIARSIGVSRERVRHWLNSGLETVLQSPMRHSSPDCSDPNSATTCSLIESVDEPAYAYLLGQYLGDGNISAYPRTFRLRISACDAYPGIMAEIEVAIRAVMASNVVGRAHCIGCTQSVRIPSTGRASSHSTARTPSIFARSSCANGRTTSLLIGIRVSSCEG